MKKLLRRTGMLVGYFAAVVLVIILLAWNTGLSEEEALLILILAAVCLLAVLMIRGVMGRRRRKRRSGSTYQIDSGTRQRAEQVYRKKAEAEAEAAATAEVAVTAEAAATNSIAQEMSRDSGRNPGGDTLSAKLEAHRKRRRKMRLAVAGLVVVVVALAGSIFFVGRNRIPESLRKFGQKYPEAEQFVQNYPSEHGKTHEIDLSAEVSEAGIPLFIQWDERWGYETYGSDLLAITGCGPTCMSMVVCGLTKTTKWDPLSLANFSEENGYYVPGEGTSWDLMTEGAAALGLQAETGEVSEAYIQGELALDTPMICSVYPGDFTYSGHFIVLAGWYEDGTVIVNDPNSRINSAAHWESETLLPQIRSIWRYTL